jgi:hypothetical protein
LFTEGSEALQHEVRNSHTSAVDKGMHRRRATACQHHEWDAAADQSASLADRPVNECGGGVPGALDDSCPSGTAEKTPASVGAALRSPSDAVSIAQQCIYHERRRRDDGATTVTALAIHQVDGHGGANTNYHDRFSFGEVVGANGSREPVHAQPPRLDIPDRHSTSPPLRGHELRRGCPSSPRSE